MHLQNMCIFNGKAILFDGIEFNDSYACCDVWADLAFFLMDLRFKKYAAYETLTLNRYLEHCDDFEGLPLLPLYLSYRAAVRAKVNCLSLNTNSDLLLRSNITRDAYNYLILANEFLTKKSSLLIGVGGLSGTGKSTLAMALAKEIGAIHIRSDAVRKHIFGISPYDKAPEAAYTDSMSEKTYKAMLTRAEYAFKTGRPVIMDAVYLSETKRNELGKLAEKYNMTFFGVWCFAPDEITKKRLYTRKNDISDADESIYQFQLKTTNWKYHME
jgi:uncharacterized protein